MRVFAQSIVLQEVPGEVSLAFAVSGCPRACPGCSWGEDKDHGEELSYDQYKEVLESHVGLVTCILFLGGEWANDFIKFVSLARELGFTTCLYTGATQVDDVVKAQLTYVKTGEYVAELGGLDSVNTNQVFTDLRTGEVCNSKFRRDV